MKTDDELKLILKYDVNLDILHIYNEILKINTDIFNTHKLKLKDIKTIKPNIEGINKSCIKVNYNRDKVELDVKINYFKEDDKCLLENIIVILQGEDVTPDELVSISNIIDNVFLGGR